MQNAEAAPLEQRWEPLSLEDVKKMLASVAAPWWIAGGRALDMFVGHETRTHVDIDVAVLRRDQQAFREALGKWDVQIAHDGAFIPWKRGDTITDPDHHEIWARETPDGPWRIELLFEESDGSRWMYRRNPSIGLNVADLGRRDAYGIQFLRPEVVLVWHPVPPTGGRAAVQVEVAAAGRRNGLPLRAAAAGCRAERLARRRAVHDRPVAPLAATPEMKEARLSAGPFFSADRNAN